MSVTPHHRLSYSIDAQDRITEVSAEWDEFALANDGETAVAARIVGTALFDHIVDPTLTELLRKLIERVREQRRRIELPFRCDSPSMIRAMRLALSPSGGGAVRFDSELLNMQPRPHRADVLDRHRPRGGDMLRVCSWCNSIYMDGTWLEIGDAIADFGLFEQPPLPPISHGICERCVDVLDAEIA